MIFLNQKYQTERLEGNDENKMDEEEFFYKYKNDEDLLKMIPLGYLKTYNNHPCQKKDEEKKIRDMGGKKSRKKDIKIEAATLKVSHVKINEFLFISAVNQQNRSMVVNDPDDIRPNYIIDKYTKINDSSSADNNRNIDINSRRKPKDFDDISYHLDKEEWINAINEEFYIMKKLNVFKEVQFLPNDVNIGFKNVKNRNIIKRKARLVPRDFYIEAPKGNPMYNKGYLKLNKAHCEFKQAENNTKEIYCIIYMWTTYYLQEEIKMYFNIKDKGDVDFIIGIKFEKCHNVKFKQSNSLPIKNLKSNGNSELLKGTCDETLYRSEINNFIYLGVCTGPDILFAVNKAARRKQESLTLED
ncbi:hypothetical protein H8356DRAFT_1340882 [Neocallimastix lanati (nom. inval.)]|nr:hypothetical protein H8356DRAFT_1340882 [Neocallimastix sp. JGI-2020a]